MKNIIFDFGQVLIHFNEDAMTRRYVKNKADCQTVKTVVFDRIYWDRFDDGTLTTTQAKPLMSARLPEHLHKKAFAVLCTKITSRKINVIFAQIILKKLMKSKEIY